MTLYIGVFGEIEMERERQNAKWGEQNHPSIGAFLDARAPERAAEEFEIPTEARAKFMCQSATERKELTFTHIIVEELCEAVAAKDDTERRIELIQLGACVVQWIEALDRKSTKQSNGNETKEEK